PALSAILAWFIFGENLSLLQMSGGLVVIIGIYIARRGTR
ncbi:MAG: EamA family transporter, partial [Rhodospirillaceae bacterium]|nr:EamA family transporter [Rhodospirillaceae bacterium]